MGKALATDRLVTAADLLAMPADGQRRELIRGRLVTMPPAGYEHGAMGMRLMVQVGHWALTHDLGEVCMAETGFHVEFDPDTVLAPDGAFIARDRLPADPEAGFGTIVPDLVFETVSPGDSRRQVEQKARLWLAVGAKVVWILWLRQRQLHVWRADAQPLVLGPDDTLTGEDLLPGFALPLSAVFG